MAGFAGSPDSQAALRPPSRERYPCYLCILHCQKKNIYCMYTVPNLIRFLGKSLSPHLILISEISEYKSRNVSGDIFFEIVQEIFKKMVQDIL